MRNILVNAGKFTPTGGTVRLRVQALEAVSMSNCRTLCVMSVPTGEKALKVLHESVAPDIIISELELPDISGFELMGRVVGLSRKHGRPAPPSRALSGRTGSSDRQLAAEAAFDLFLAKPVTPDRLVEALTDLREILRAKRGSAGSAPTRSPSGHLPP